ncbi:MAG: hypothetical protein U9O97_07495 [Elusimicrobiota bacterium]|nr:hypothetical protein [Elusimicrobiota bacterium]
MNKRNFVWPAAALIFAAALVFYLRSSVNFKVYDEWGVARNVFPYVKWDAAIEMFSAEVSETLDYRTFRTRDGDIIMLYGVAAAFREKEAVRFMKKQIAGKSVVIYVCGTQDDYSGIIRGIVFYGEGERCLNKDVYDAGFADIKISDKYLSPAEWFDAETD